MNIPNAQIAALHARYEFLTGLSVPLNKLWSYEYLWGDFMRHGWGEAELELVIRHLKREFPKPFPAGSLVPLWQKKCNLRSLIGDPETFGLTLAEAQAVARNAIKPRSNRDQALASLTTNSAEVGSRVVDGPKPTAEVTQQILQKLGEAMRKAIE